jgi:CDP-diacylglycerol--serine O-phosphatidyltransferase
MKILKVLGLADVLSLANAALGLSAVLLCARGSFLAPVIMIFLAASFDGIDGMLARRRRQSVLGMNLDSLADLVSFGIAPATIAWVQLGTGWTSVHLIAVSWISCCIYLVCGILRLARFNVSPTGRSGFEGLPITAAGVALSSFLLLGVNIASVVMMVALSALMISSIPYPKITDHRIILMLFGAGFPAVLIGWHLADLRIPGGVIFATMIPYLFSPVVMSYRRSGN